MNSVHKYMMAFFAIGVGIAMIVGAVVISNHLIVQNEVVEQGVTITQTDIDSTEYGQDWVNLPHDNSANILKGQTYDFGLLYESTVDANVVFKITISNADVAVPAITDVIVQYWDLSLNEGLGGYATVTLALDTEANTLVGIIGPVTGFVVDAYIDVTASMLITYNTIGSYTLDFTAETL